VIPGDAEATLDVRAVPDEDMDKLVADLTRLIDDPLVQIVRSAAGRPSAAAFGIDSEMFRALEKRRRQCFRVRSRYPPC